MKKYLTILFFLIGCQLFAQNNDIQLGSQYSPITQRQGGVFDYSDPETINMHVSVWGFVKYPGRYLVPIYTSVSDLLSLAGGPNENSELSDLRLYRVMEDSTQHMFKFDFEDLLWDNEINLNNRKVPKLQGSDLLVVPGEPRLYFKDWFRLGLSIISAAVTLWLLILRFE